MGTCQNLIIKSTKYVEELNKSRRLLRSRAVEKYTEFRLKLLFFIRWGNFCTGINRSLFLWCCDAVFKFMRKIDSTFDERFEHWLYPSMCFIEIDDKDNITSIAGTSTEKGKRGGGQGLSGNFESSKSHYWRVFIRDCSTKYCSAATFHYAFPGYPQHYSALFLRNTTALLIHLCTLICVHREQGLSC